MVGEDTPDDVVGVHHTDDDSFVAGRLAHRQLPVVEAGMRFELVMVVGAAAGLPAASRAR